jgi:hypothetical protein
MHVLLIVIGLLLMLFGGGCVLIGGGVLGLPPLVIGWLLFRTGFRIGNRKRRAGVSDLPQQGQPWNNEP